MCKKFNVCYMDMFFVFVKLELLGPTFTINSLMNQF